jgi:hypothetical protein
MIESLVMHSSTRARQGIQYRGSANDGRLGREVNIVEQPNDGIAAGKKISCSAERWHRGREVTIVCEPNDGISLARVQAKEVLAKNKMRM